MNHPICALYMFITYKYIIYYRYSDIHSTLRLLLIVIYCLILKIPKGGLDNTEKREKKPSNFSAVLNNYVYVRIM